MPYSSGSQFASKHNKKLKGEAAEKAASQANAMLEKGADEGTAIATANKTGDKAMSRNGRMQSKMYNKKG